MILLLHFSVSWPTSFEEFSTKGKINWNDSAKNIIGKINGLYPTPGAFFVFNGQRYKILKAEVGNGVGNVGEVISDNL